MTITDVLSGIRSALMPSDAASAATATVSRQQIRQDLQTLNGDLKAGNLASAQQDFAALLNDDPQLQTQIGSSLTTPQANALNSLSSSLQAGNLSGAQAAFESLRQTMPEGHRHHPMGEWAQSGAAGSGAQVRTDIQSLNSALQSGDLASAQQAFAQLQKDDPRVAAALAQSAGGTAATATGTTASTAANVVSAVAAVS